MMKKKKAALYFALVFTLVLSLLMMSVLYGCTNDAQSVSRASESQASESEGSATESSTSPDTSSSTSSSSATDLVQTLWPKLEGYWTSLDDPQVFVYFGYDPDTREPISYSGWLLSEMPPTGFVSDVTEGADNTFTIAIKVPENKEPGPEMTDEYSYDMTIDISDMSNGKIEFFTNNSSVGVFEYSATLDEAIEKYDKSSK